MSVYLIFTLCLLSGTGLSRACGCRRETASCLFLGLRGDRYGYLTVPNTAALPRGAAGKLTSACLGVINALDHLGIARRSAMS